MFCPPFQNKVKFNYFIFHMHSNCCETVIGNEIVVVPLTLSNNAQTICLKESYTNKMPSKQELQIIQYLSERWDVLQNRRM